MMMRSIPVLLFFTCLSLNAQTPDQAELEARFAKQMNGCRMVGAFTVDGSEEPPSEESYTISKVEKLEGDQWRFSAEMKFGLQSFTFPIAVNVRWAGDTPMIQVTDLAFPTGGRYTARVLIYGDRYAGTWSGGPRGGAMFGRVESLKKKGDDSAEGEGKEEASAPRPGVDWPGFRGIGAQGHSDGVALPESFDLESGENVLWKSAIKGMAHSSPAIWGDRIYLTNARRKAGDSELRVGLYGGIAPVKDEGEHDMELLCFNKKDGSLIWSRTVWSGEPEIMRHTKGSHAASSPATNGRYVLAWFASEGLYCYSSEGELVWKRDFGTLDSGYFMMAAAQWGFASSPVIHEDKVIVQVDIQGESFVAALDLATGKDIWKTMRDEVPTWGSPAVAAAKGQVILNGFKHMGGYDLETGEEIWRIGGGGDIPVPTPIVGDDLVYITNAHGRLSPILAVSLDAKGKHKLDPKDSEAIVWGYKRRGNYMQTPILYDGLFYCCNDLGALSCYDAKTGELYYRERLGSGGAGFTSSGVAGDGKLYFAQESGEVYSVRAGKIFEVIAVSPLGEEHMSSPAISEGVIYLRGRNHLFAIGAKSE